MMTWTLRVLLGLLMAPWATPTYAATEAQVVHAVAGNRRVTVGIDASGGLVQLRWPSLGYFEHMGSDPDDETGGARWLLAEGDTVYAFDPPTWETSQETSSDGTLITHYQEREGERRAEQRLFVTDAEDMVVVELRLEGFSLSTYAFWYQRAAPSTQLVAGMVGAEHGSIGFGNYYDDKNNILVQFRPKAPGHADWERARRLESEAAPSLAWSIFGTGAYLGVFSPPGVLGGACAPITESQARLVDAIKRGSALRSSVGPGHGLLHLQPEAETDNRQRYRICLLLASTGEDLHRRHQNVMEDGIPGKSRWQMRSVGPLGQPQDHAPSLLACVDKLTGAAVLAPLSQPPLAYASVFNTVWVSAALDALGRSGLAEGVLEFHLDTMRLSPTTQGLSGSVPALVYTSGAPAQFIDRANPESTAWLLAAMWRHSATLAPEEARKFLLAVEDRVLAGGDFLARASDVGGVLSGALKPTATTLVTLRTHYLGLISARAIVEFLGQEELGHWRSRREEAYARIRFQQLDQAQTALTEPSWLEAWVASMPERALSDDAGAWQVLVSPSPVDWTALSQAYSAGLPPLQPKIPVGVIAAVGVLAAK